MPRFKLYRERQLIREYTFDEGPILIGRSPDNQIVIDHESVSRKHAQIIRKGSAWVVEKLPGRNPLVVNSNVCSFRVISHRDKIEVWKYVIEYVEDAATGPALTETGPSAAAPQSAPSSADVASKLDAIDGMSTASLSMAEFVAIHGRNRDLMKAHLRWIDADRKEQICQLGKEGCVIGTGVACNVRITGGMMGISRYAKVSPDGEHFVIESLSKLVVVQINGAPLKGSRRLEDGDEIRIAKVRIEFRQSL
ncbi:MAG TPA: hypothetical protein DIU15_20400 [Deltaproteobacteria bacterium]|nr:hypothetical protein [Deltaproteobacteria bacterium]HCP48409.1 hypothetical protein [Deltaproteobacteria bacterium]|tara:strand:- start:72 stop:824 length:753 start_codon:yes stop_codon:yes gene_type:complete